MLDHHRGLRPHLRTSWRGHNCLSFSRFGGDCSPDKQDCREELKIKLLLLDEHHLGDLVSTDDIVQPLDRLIILHGVLGSAGNIDVLHLAVDHADLMKDLLQSPGLCYEACDTA